ncbi:MAG: AMP-binding protein [Planctomycetota bacterium]
MNASADWQGLLDDGVGQVWDRAERERRVAECADALATLCTQELAAGRLALGLLADNGLPWALADLAAQRLGAALVPLPHFFTTAQLRHVLGVAGLNGLIVDAAAVTRAEALLGPGAELVSLREGLAFARLPEPLPSAVRGGEKVTFTSGTTGEPKGVRLSHVGLLEVTRSLVQATGIGPSDVHVALLPLSVLLENVGGLYRGLSAGARVVLPPASRIGLAGSSAQRGDLLVASLAELQATTAILVPQTLALIVEQLERGVRLPALRFLGVGGAPVPLQLLERAQRLGLPVFEGYGLSEAGSVVALNRPDSRHAGTVGRPLPHVEVRLAEDREVLVRGSAWLGYVGGEPAPLRSDGWLATGDLGAFDEHGHLSLVGRKSAVLRTAFGRKLSPEWVERELLTSPAVAAACVLGDGLPQPRAVLVPADVGPTDDELAAAVDSANARLPDYARVEYWVRASAPFSASNGQLSVAGRLRRAAVATAYPHLLTLPAPLPAHISRAPMTFHDRLCAETAAQREDFFRIPFVRAAVHGELDLPAYVAFLTQAYHHVKHTVPLLMATGARLSDRHEWLRAAIGEYIAEETGHQQWILDDIAACGGDAEAVAAGKPDLPCELMVAYAWDTVLRGDPVGFFGMVHVLEGVSARGATGAAAGLQRSLGLPDGAVRYLSSHGALDQGHVAFFETLMNRLDSEADRQAVLHAARVFFRLYGDVFRALPTASQPSRAPLGACA